MLNIAPRIAVCFGVVLMTTPGFAGTRPVAAETLTPIPYDVDTCVRVAIEGSAKIEEAEAKITQWRARLAEVEASYYPKLFGMAILAPMFTVEWNEKTREVTRKYQRLSDWGPYAFIEAVLAQPLYSFGRIEAGELAASERLEVERARYREAKNIVALEVRKFYYLHLYTQSMKPSLANANEVLTEAQEKAQEMYDAGSGDVTQVDLMKIAYGRSELGKVRIRLEEGSKLSMLALKHTMGWPANRELILAEKRLARKIKDTEPDLAKMMQAAAENRPEWAQITHGERAALALEDAEKLANAPVVFLAGQFRAGWTPMRTDANSPYDFDRYNDIFAGFGLGLQFDLDPWATAAKAERARGIYDEVRALHRFAATGIPLQVSKAHADMRQARVIHKLSREGVKATRKWMTFAASAFMTGAGEAKDVLEGLAAYLGAKNGQYESMRDYMSAKAEMTFAIGESVSLQ